MEMIGDAQRWYPRCIKESTAPRARPGPYRYVEQHHHPKTTKRNISSRLRIREFFRSKFSMRREMGGKQNTFKQEGKVKQEGVEQVSFASLITHNHNADGGVDLMMVAI
jgi:hypothetical protein